MLLKHQETFNKNIPNGKGCDWLADPAYYNIPAATWERYRFNVVVYARSLSRWTWRRHDGGAVSSPLSPDLQLVKDVKDQHHSQGMLIAR